MRIVGLKMDQGKHVKIGKFQKNLEMRKLKKRYVNGDVNDELDETLTTCTAIVILVDS